MGPFLIKISRRGFALPSYLPALGAVRRAAEAFFLMLATMTLILGGYRTRVIEFYIMAAITGPLTICYIFFI